MCAHLRAKHGIKFISPRALFNYETERFSRFNASDYGHGSKRRRKKDTDQESSITTGSMYVTREELNKCIAKVHPDMNKNNDDLGGRVVDGFKEAITQLSGMVIDVGQPIVVRLSPHRMLYSMLVRRKR